MEVVKWFGIFAGHFYFKTWCNAMSRFVMMVNMATSMMMMSMTGRH